MSSREMGCSAGNGLCPLASGAMISKWSLTVTDSEGIGIFGNLFDDPLAEALWYMLPRESALLARVRSTGSCRTKKTGS